MADKKPRQPIITSPKGVFGYTYIDKPDDKFAKPGEKGDYKTELTTDAASAAPLIAKIDPLVDKKFDETLADLKAKGKGKAAKELRKHYPYEVLEDADGEPTGKVKFKLKVNAEGKNDKGETWDNKPPLFDAKGKPTDKKVYSGSEGKVSFQLGNFYNAATGHAGVNLRLKAVQVIKLVTGGSASAGSYGFGEEEGYEGDSDDASEAFKDESDTDGATGDDEDVDF